jgi:hypothetical protein
MSWLDVGRHGLARALYGAGLTGVEIARRLRVNEVTICRWKAHDAAEGVLWEEYREALRYACPDLIEEDLWVRLRAVGRRTDMDPLVQAGVIVRLADALTKVQSLRDKARRRAADEKEETGK